MDINNKLVVLFKSVKEGTEKDPYLTALSKSGFQCACIPVLGFTFINLECLYKSLSNPDSYSGIVFTSPRAVEAVRHCIDAHSEESERSCHLKRWGQVPSFVVGKATGEEAVKLGFQVTGEDSGSAEQLAPVIIKAMAEESKPVLFPCGNLRRETLPKALQEAGVPLEGVTVYETSGDQQIESNLTDLVSEDGVPGYMVFYSPSGVAYTYDILQKLGLPLSSIRMIAIGPTTRDALRQKGLDVSACASKPTPEHLNDAITGIK